MIWTTLLLSSLLMAMHQPQPSMFQQVKYDSRAAIWLSSRDAEHPNIEFRMSYAVGDSSGYSALEYITGTTPFTKEFDKPMLFAIVTSAKKGELVEVTAKSLNYTVPTGSATGSSSLNVVRIENRVASYGFRSISE